MKQMSAIESPRQKQMRRLIAGTLISGSLVGALALAMPKRDVRTEAVPAPTTEVATEQPKAAATVAVDNQSIPKKYLENNTAMDDDSIVVASEHPKVALPIPHDEEDQTNYYEVAQLMTDQGDIKGAFDALRKHIYKSEPTAEVLLNIGRFGRQLGEHAVAEQALMDAAALEAKNADVQTELARVLLEVGELDDARMHARQAIRINPDDAIAWNVAGRVAMQQREWARAEGAYRRALELDPMNAMVHNNIGLLYIYTSRSSDAVDSLETSVELFGENVPSFAYNNLGLAHEMAGNYEEARDAFEEAVTVNPQYARAAVNLKRVLSTIATREEKASYQTANVDDGEKQEL